MTCHLFPEPGLLGKEAWREAVLPRMGVLLGRAGERDAGAPAGTYPAEPLLGDDEWAALVAYYLAAAPDALPGAAEGRPRVELGLDWFEVERPAETRQGAPATTAVAVDEAGQRAVVGDATNGRVLFYDEGREVTGSADVGGVPADVRPEPGGQTLVTVIGPEVGPSHGSDGRVLRVGRDGAVAVLLEGLARPVAAMEVAGGMLVGEFGHVQGRLTRAAGDERVVLDGKAGAVRLSASGKLVLMAQGDERVLRIGDRAEVETVLRFPPAYGSNDLAEGDFDGDGDLDLVVVAGDNADDTPVFKPYHGLRLYENTGEAGYRLRRFHPMHGAYGVTVADFDGDGDADLAAVAFFADYGGGEEGFVVLENGGGWQFAARTVEGIGRLGRFAVIASGDLDGDDDVDLVLGNFPGGPAGPEPVGEALMGDWLGGGRIVVLRNVLED